MVDLRAYCVIDSLQPQFASFQATVAQGFLPRVGQASLFVEIAPGIEINRVTDIALKSTNVTPGMQIVERHSALELTEEDRLKPRIVSDQVVRHLDDHQCMLINRMRHGNLILAGQTLFVLECEPAAYAALAANEAEKAAHINILEVRAFGSFGRVYIGGEESDIEVARPAAVAALESLVGRTVKRQEER